MRSASGDACNCMSPTEHCWVISATRSVTTTGTGWLRESDRLEPFGNCSATSARTTAGAGAALPSRSAGGLADNASSAHTPARIRGRTGPKRGRTTCTSSTPWRQRRAPDCPFDPSAATSRPWTQRSPNTLGILRQMIDGWFPLTYLLNNLNRGMGLPDGYPFVLSTLVIDKLRFVHTIVEEHRNRSS